MRHTGLDAIGDVAWGTHICHFYETRSDLLDIQIPFFRAGLEAHEQCVWVTFDPVDEETARSAFRSEVRDADEHLAAGDIEILPHSRFYLEAGRFDPDRVIRWWEARHEDAIRKGYAGLRVSGNEAWLTEKEWVDFAEYERQLDRVVRGRKTIVLCAYDLASRRAADVFDVADAHQVAVACRCGRWQSLESDQRFHEIAENIRDVFWVHTANIEHALYVNPAYERIWERPRSDACGDRHGLLETIHPEDRTRIAATLDALPTNEFSMEYRILTPNGGVRWIRDRRFPIRDARGWISRFAGVAEDLTDRKHAEQRLIETNAKLRALSAKAHAARDEEGSRIAREIHDELGSVLTSLKWDLEGVQRDVSAGERRIERVPARLATMIQLSEDAIAAVRRIASEMRPPLLEGLGLADAIQLQVDQFETRSGARCSCDLPGQPLRVTEEQATAVFRILQEALTNVMRHARASLVGVQVTQDSHQLVLVVHDDGAGMGAGVSTGEREPLGIVGMHERARLVGGLLRITSAPGRGTTLRFSLPLAPEESGLVRGDVTE